MRGRFLKHKKYKDVCFRVLNHFPFENFTKFKIEWWNLGYVDSYSMGIREYTDIQYSDYENWEYTYNYDGFACLRNATWMELKNG